MERNHQGRHETPIERPSDVWPMLARAEEVVTATVRHDPADWQTSISVEVRDSGGTATSEDVATARADAESSRHTLDSVLLHATTRAVDASGLSGDLQRSIQIRASYLSHFGTRSTVIR